jgi:hypothetical protein
VRHWVAVGKWGEILSLNDVALDGWLARRHRDPSNTSNDACRWILDLLQSFTVAWGIINCGALSSRYHDPIGISHQNRSCRDDALSQTSQWGLAKTRGVSLCPP